MVIIIIMYNAALTKSLWNLTAWQRMWFPTNLQKK